MTRTLFAILLSLIVVGCSGIDSKYTSNIPQKNEYWNVVDKDGPKSSDEAINLFQKRSDLDLIEGLWIDNNNTTFLIILENRNFSIYRVEGPYLSIRGIKDGTIFRSGGSRVYQAQEAVVVDDKIQAAGPVTYKLINNNSLEITANFAGGQKFYYNRTYPEYKKIDDKDSSPSIGAVVSGTAFFINQNGYLITNHHVIKGCQNKSKISYNKQDIEAVLVASDSNLDLALLKANIKNKNFIKISGKDPKKLQRIIAAGYPLGKRLSDDLKLNSGIISALKGGNDNSNQIQIDASINSGNSGGPIVDEKTGELVAVSVSLIKKEIATNINFGIKAEAVSSFLKANGLKEPLSNSQVLLKNDEVLKIIEESTVFTYCRI
jgi:S1-C subfamily serine protease